MLHERSAVELRAALRSGQVSPQEAVAHFLDRISRRDGELGAFVEVTAEAALDRAETLDATTPAAARSDAALWGLPTADKDLVAREGVPTRYGSLTRAAHVPETSDPLALALDATGAISLGKTNTPEFGLTGYTESAVAPAARDPWDPRNGAGGSSGGAAVAVAAGMLPVAIGSDGGGSIRIPAATVGVVGLKPSRGRIAVDSPTGLVVTGPLARSVADAELVWRALAPAAPLPRDAGALRVGVTTVSPWDDDEDIRLDAAARMAVSWAADTLADAGNAVSAARWRPHGYAALFRVLWRASAARLSLSEAELARVEPITAWLVREGRELPSGELAAAQSAAVEFERETIAAFAPYDAVLTPALALPPRPVGWFDPGDPERNFAQQVQYAPYSSFVNVAGLPAITIPVTRDATGHPVSAQLVGRPGGEAELFRLAAQLEARRGPLPHPPRW
ncbi:amidase [Microbacterium sp. SORGH_AS_0888]|uniref:amidase n=1 Tax=Microbacterium sp. SORGH_AS_0888 TaxID=3041791 RepID=UPI002787FF92|nr:amidase [Microbacterium sp. SORGH_AS_0888]MDQ1127989.1 amidase [Microbacterium sp. SORGH_AS_0888]